MIWNLTVDDPQFRTSTFIGGKSIIEGVVDEAGMCTFLCFFSREKLSMKFSCRHVFRGLWTVLLFALILGPDLAMAAVEPQQENASEIPLPEHPCPDRQRPEWTNLNGKWSFRLILPTNIVFRADEVISGGSELVVS